MNPILYYVHDPMCSWCWGFSRSLKELLAQLPKEVKVHRLLGGLASDTDFPMPESMQQQIKSSWARIEDTITGVKFNFSFWEINIPRRSTYPACRAVIAARKQGKKYDVLMTKAIQKAYYHDALNPSDDSILVGLAEGLNLNINNFKKDLVSKETQQVLRDEINYSQELFAESYPSLILKSNGELFTITIDYQNSQTMIDMINSHL